MIDLQSVSLMDILPESLKRDPQVRALAEAITPELQAITLAISNTMLLPRLDDLDEEVVDLLAWQLHVDFYESDLPLEQKRDLVSNSTLWHARKGTPWAVEKVVSVIFRDAKVAEWFEYGGEPYHFRIETAQPMSSATDLHRLVRLIDATKNARSHLESITVNRRISGDLFFGGVVSEYKVTRIEPFAFEMSNLQADIRYGGIVSTVNKTTIGVK